MTQGDNTTQPTCLALERLSSVLARTGLSRSDIYRKAQLGKFPKPVKLGDRASAWPEHEVTAWIAERIAARERAS